MVDLATTAEEADWYLTGTFALTVPEPLMISIDLLR